MDGRRGTIGALNDAEIERIACELGAIEQSSAWERILRVGRIVFERIAGGNEREWVSQRGRKNVSLRKLEQHSACPFRKTALSSAVGVHLFVQTNPSVPAMPGITPTHVGQVAGLKPARALQLLGRAVSGGWTVRELRQHVTELRKETGERRGRPPSPAEKKAATLARRAAMALRATQAQLASCSAVTDESLASVVDALDEISDLVASLRALPALGRKSSVLLTLAKVSHGHVDAARDAAAG